jgi:hypothetical protein
MGSWKKDSDFSGFQALSPEDMRGEMRSWKKTHGLTQKTQVEF